MSKIGEGYGWITSFRSSAEEGGDDDDPDVELSVVREDAHGADSWGWDGPDKIILLSGPYYPQEIIDKVRKLAEKLTEELNAEEK